MEILMLCNKEKRKEGKGKMEGKWRIGLIYWCKYMIYEERKKNIYKKFRWNILVKNER